MDEMMSDEASDKEEAEGLRENVNLGEQAGDLDRANGAENPMERGSGQLSEPDTPPSATKRPPPNRDDTSERTG